MPHGPLATRSAGVDLELVFLSCSRPVTPVAIPEPFSSSSLPPSLARGRCTTDFSSADGASRAVSLGRSVAGGAP